MTTALQGLVLVIGGVAFTWNMFYVEATFLGIVSTVALLAFLLAAASGLGKALGQST